MKISIPGTHRVLELDNALTLTCPSLMHVVAIAQ